MVPLGLDYRRIAGILRSAGFHGYVSLEMEARGHGDRRAKSLDVCAAFGG